MSRGLGRWQRFILEGLAHSSDGHGGRLLVTEYAKQQLGRSLTPAEQRAITRAAAALEERGLCRCLYQPAAAKNRTILPRRLHVVHPGWTAEETAPVSEVVEPVEDMAILLERWYAAPIRARRSAPPSDDPE